MESHSLPANEFQKIRVVAKREAYVASDGFGGFWPLWLPTMKRVRATEAFKALVRDIGFAELWRATNDWGDFCRPLDDNDFECE